MKSAGKARNNGLYRHIRTSKEIIRNLLNDYDKDYANTVLELQAAVRLQGAGTESYRGSCYCTCQ